MCKKILFCASRASHLQNFHLPYMLALQERGYEIHAVCQGDFAGRGKMILHEMNFDKNLHPFRIISTVLQLRQLIRTQHFSLISAHATLASAICRLAYILSGVYDAKVVYTCHGYLFTASQRLGKWIGLACEKLFSFVTDHVITMNEEDFQTAKKFRLGRHIHNSFGMGLQEARYCRIEKEEQETLRTHLGIASHEMIFLCVGEFSKRKNQKLLIRAMSNLKEIPFKLLFLGEGGSLQACKQEAIDLGIASQCIFCGFIREVSQFYSICDVVLAASIVEGLPVNIMEALYFQCPVIASDIKGHRDLLQEQPLCRLYPLQEDAPVKIRNCLKEIQFERIRTLPPTLKAQYFYEQASLLHLKIYQDSLQ